jgi:hypothetical protein
VLEAPIRGESLDSNQLADRVRRLTAQHGLDGGALDVAYPEDSPTRLICRTHVLVTDPHARFDLLSIIMHDISPAFQLRRSSFLQAGHAENLVCISKWAFHSICSLLVDG